MRLQPDCFRKRLFKGYFSGMSSTGFFMCMIIPFVFMVMPLMIVIMSFFMLVSFVFVLSVSRSIPTATRSQVGENHPH